MKKIVLMVALSFIGSSNLLAQEGSTKGFYSKPGAPVDLTYRSDPIENNSSGDINITLESTAQSGKMEVELEFDKNITNLSKTPLKFSFEITQTKKSFPIMVKVGGVVDGLFYIRLFVTMQEDLEKRVRSLAVPVYIGDSNISRTSSFPAPIMLKATSMPRENITIFKAKENFIPSVKVDKNSTLETNATLNPL